ncbi:MAG: hypothetical protein HKN75_00160 [Bacteroidia bacterium]|nr:hypothetical protein [Bacteroidia bacterium]
MDNSHTELVIEANIDYHPTELPILLEKLSKEQIAFITKLTDADTSSYYIESRPVVFQVVQAVNDDNQTRWTRRINQATDVMIYALGEVKDSVLVDYGWIENEHGETVWKMEYHLTEYAGGDKRNRKQVEKFVLSPGSYTLKYVTNHSHATDNWEGNIPENVFNYGITVFNTKAIEKIQKEFE